MKTLDDFKRAFPGLFDHPGVFDFSVPPGWLDLVWALCEKLEPLGLVRCVQVKSKFGGLRFYVEPLAPRLLPSESAQINQLINEAESKSQHTCEECGLPGETQGSLRGWVSTRCGLHLRGRETPPTPPTKEEKP